MLSDWVTALTGAGEGGRKTNLKWSKKQKQTFVTFIGISNLLYSHAHR